MNIYYNKYFVESISKSKIDGIINGTIPFNVDAMNKNNKKTFVVLQHRLIKYFMEARQPHPNAIKLINDYYKEFSKYPYAFCDSPLLNNNTIDLFANMSSQNQDRNNRARDQIKNYRNNYYNRESINNLYNQYVSQNGNISDEEKNRLFAYLIATLGNKDNKSSNEVIAKIILNNNNEIKNMNIMELKFYSQYIANHAKANYPIRPEIHIFDDDINLGGFQNNYYICINKNSVLTRTLADVTQTVCHEVQHSIQKYKSTNVINKEAFVFAQYELFQKYLSNSSYDSYHRNYTYSPIEIDAEHNGYFNGGVYLRMLGRPDLAEKVMLERKARLDKRTYYEYMINEQGKASTVESFIVTHMDEIIRNHPEELNNYPVLSVIYKKDGTKKSFESILAHRNIEDVSNRGIVDDYINYGILHDELNNLNYTDIHQYESLFKTLSSYFRTTSVTLQDYMKDKNTNANIKQIEKMTLPKIYLLDKILEYVNANIDKLMQTRENNRISNTSYIYNFIYDFRDFTFDFIDNPALKNSNLINDALKELMKKHEFLVYNFNKQYIEDRTINMSETEKREVVVGLDGNKIRFDEMLASILPKLNGHMTYNINGKELYIGDIVEYYKRNIKSENIRISNRIDSLKNEVRKLNNTYKTMIASGSFNINDLENIINRLSSLLVAAKAMEKEKISDNEKEIVKQLCSIILDGQQKIQEFKKKYIDKVNQKYNDEDDTQKTM